MTRCTAWVVAIGALEDGGVRIQEVLRGSVRVGDWLAVDTDRTGAALVVVVTAPDRVTADRWSVLGSEWSERVRQRLAEVEGACR